jgi:hypothetical protein
MTSRDPHEHDSLDEDGRLANRTTLLTLACLCCFLLAAVTMPLTFQRMDRLARRVPDSGRSATRRTQVTEASWQALRPSHQQFLSQHAAFAPERGARADIGP